MNLDDKINQCLPSHEEKIEMIETLLGNCYILMDYLHKNIKINRDYNVDYAILNSIANLGCFVFYDQTRFERPEFKSYSFSTDSVYKKLIETLKLMNEVYLEDLKNQDE